MKEDDFENYISLAQVIAIEYTNIPKTTLDELVSEAMQAMWRAHQSYDSTKGDFAPYASRAIRNSLNTLYAKHLKIAKIFPISLDERPLWSSANSVGMDHSTTECGFIDTKQNTRKNIQFSESGKILSEVLKYLSPREFTVIEGIKIGMSLSEIGDKMGISKQAAHKISKSALAKLKNKLELVGFTGLDTEGFLKSATRVSLG